METINADSQKLRYYAQDPIKDPYAQISSNGFTPVGNLKTYGVANLYDRPEPTHLRDLRELYTVPYATTPFLGNNVPSRKFVDVDSETLRYPVFQNKKSAIDISQVTYFPQQINSNNPSVSPELNNFYNQMVTINMPGRDSQVYSKDIDPMQVKLGQENFGLESNRYINRWNVVDPKVTQNVDHIIMNMKDLDGNLISLHQCGISSRNELRNYVELNKC
jgi:hypothetical protein